MSPVETTQPDSSAGVVPSPRPTTPWRIVSVRPDDEFRLHVVFADGTAGDVQLRDFVESRSVAGTLFEALREPAYFRQVRLDLGAVTWPNGADLAPDAMYDAIRANGHWVVAA
jgi:hypothetical protein